jgi:CRP-like cAMP-binding protein
MLQNFLQHYRIFTQKEIDDLVSLFVHRTLKKGDTFIKEGAYCTEIAFIQSGLFRSFYTTDAGDENTYCFRFPNQLLAPYSAFVTGTSSLETQQALEHAELLVITKAELQTFHSPRLESFLRVHAEQEYLELEHRYFQLQRDSAKTRYQTLLVKQPEYIQHIPLQFLASYLGITQRHLSRIRREISF